MVQIFAVVLLLIIATGCNNSEHIGGPCSYTGFQGSAIITSIETADSSLNNCRDAVEVLFDFTPDDNTAPNRYKFPTWPDTSQHLTGGDGKNPSLDWVVAKEIVVGKVYRCSRQEIKKGTCVPVIFTIEGIDFSDWAAYCF